MTFDAAKDFKPEEGSYFVTEDDEGSCSLASLDSSHRSSIDRTLPLKSSGSAGYRRSRRRFIDCPL